ncbi:MAG: dienelactone hydrolase family protein, partial [Gammaproteobacteria bacterium]
MSIFSLSKPAGLFTLIVILLAGCQAPYPKGVTPVQATWLLGYHTIPARYTRDHLEKFWRHTLDWQAQASKAVRADIKIPVALYLHGCAGIGREDTSYRKLMLEQGYAVFMPDSFARNRMPCADEGSLSDRVYMRTAEVRNALQQLRKLPWVDQDRIILMGFSEGGNAVDNWSRPGFRAMIILGSACTEGSTDKPAAPGNVPVLAIVGQNDTYRPGLHCNITRTIGGSRSIVIPGAGHKVAAYPQTREA